MKKMTKSIMAMLLCVWLLPAGAFAKELIPVGQVVGLELQDNTVTVAGIDAAISARTNADKLAVGDRILTVDGKQVCSARDVQQALQQTKGKLTLSVLRDGKEKRLSLTPEITADGPKLGIYLRQGITGIGTVTYYDPDTKAFGTLGHGVNDYRGKLLPLARGNAYRARVASVRKGLCGEPGQLMGAIESTTPVGALRSNTQRGVFGVSDSGWQGRSVEVAHSNEIKAGAATILSTVSGTSVREYSVEILKIYPKSRDNGRNLLLRVTDPVLLEATGGIVQGMSGSPILQDGRIVGAVTHVLVNDPTTGYGIFIENMLDAAA